MTDHLASTNALDVLKLWYARGCTALHIAFMRKDAKVLSILLKRNPYLRARDNDGNTALHLAILRNSTAAAEIILNYINTNTLKCGKEIVNSVNNENETALHVAVDLNDVSSIKLLLNNHANLRVRDKYSGNTALHRAVRDGNLDAIECIGSCVEKRDL